MRTLVFLAIALFSTSSFAQYSGAFGTSWNSRTMAYISSTSSRYVSDNARLEKMAKAMQSQQKTGKPGPDFSRTSFTPTGARLVVEPMVAAGGTPEIQQTLRQLFTASFDGFEAQGHANNVAWAMTFLIVASRVALTGREPSDLEVDAIAANLNQELSSSAIFKKLSAREKQTIYETCVVTGGTISAFILKDDPQLTAAAKDIARVALGLAAK